MKKSSIVKCNYSSVKFESCQWYSVYRHGKNYIPVPMQTYRLFEYYVFTHIRTKVVI